MKKFHTCSSCRKELTEKESIKKGITHRKDMEVKWFNCPHCDSTFVKRIKQVTATEQKRMDAANTDGSANANARVAANPIGSECAHPRCYKTPDHNKSGDWFCPDCYATLKTLPKNHRGLSVGINPAHRFVHVFHSYTLGDSCGCIFRSVICIYLYCIFLET